VQATGATVQRGRARDGGATIAPKMHLLRDLEARARARLPPAVYDYYAGAAGDERTLAENVEAWQRVWLRPRALVDVGAVDPAVDLLGQRLAAPILLAPIAAQRLLHPDGEVASARAAAAAGSLYCLSTRATADLAEVAHGADACGAAAARWFQLYVQTDRERTRAVLGRLREHGYTQVVVTVDVAVPGRRERELAHGPVPLPGGATMTTHLPGDGTDGATAKPMIGGWDARLHWQDLGWIAEACDGLGLVVKGVLDGRDAELAIDHGASAVVVSNHGGRQLDGVVPTAVALREVVAAVAGRVPVLVDSGIRSGADVVRALALGASAVLVGRPYAWGLAAGGADGGGGEAGVREVLDALVADTARSLALVGAQTPADVTEGHVRLRGW
jgi:4-hydroxymandelate oxidase